MDAQAEQRVLATIYDRLMDAISYSPGDKPSGAVPSGSMLQMARNMVLNPADFTNAVSPMNPGPSASLAAAESFSFAVDALPADTTANWVDSSQRLSNVYKGIVANANTTIKPDPAQEKAYRQAMGYLTSRMTIKDYTGKKTTSIVPSDIAQTYDNNQTSYITAVQGYRTAYNGYDLTNTTDQREWNAVAPGLQNGINQAWNRWVQQGKAQVEQARAVLASSINNAVAAAIEQVQEDVSDAHLNADVTGTGSPWLLSFAQPQNWCDTGSSASVLNLRSAYLNQTASSEASSYSAGASAGYGLWSFGASASHSQSETHEHMDAQNFELDAELILVRIMRPWFNPLLFSMSGWYVDGFAPGQITQKFPLIPTALVVARNVVITADFTDTDKQHVESATSAGASVGWGPFSVSGSYSHSQSNDSFSSHFDGGRLALPGLQVIGVVSAKTPPNCPPEAAEAAVGALSTAD